MTTPLILSTSELWEAFKRNPEALEQLKALISSKVGPMAKELAKARQEKVKWFMAGYEFGAKDDPKQLDHLDKPSTFEQRKNKAAAQYAIDNNK